MSFQVILQDVPPEAEFWYPMFFVGPEQTPYWPAGYLPISQNTWVCPLDAGNGIKVTFGCLIYSLDKSILGSVEFDNVLVANDVDFVYQWGTVPPKGATVSAMAMAIGVPLVLGALVAIGASRRAR